MSVPSPLARYTPTSIAKRAIKETQPIGTVGLASPFAKNHWMWNGRAS